MNDYISRDAAIELLSQPITMSMCLSTEECHHKIAQQRIDRYLIENIPAADVVEVVRCVNCKYWNPRYNKSYKGHFCEVTTEYVTEHDYCSFGLRWREDDD